MWSGVSKSGSPAPRMMTGRPSRFKAWAFAPIFRISETPIAEMRFAGVKTASSGLLLMFMTILSSLLLPVAGAVLVICLLSRTGPYRAARAT